MAMTGDAVAERGHHLADLQGVKLQEEFRRAGAFGVGADEGVGPAPDDRVHGDPAALQVHARRDHAEVGLEGVAGRSTRPRPGSDRPA